MKKKIGKKLIINKETVINLNPQDLKEVKGGINVHSVEQWVCLITVNITFC